MSDYSESRIAANLVSPVKISRQERQPVNERATVNVHPTRRREPDPVAFTRQELAVILNVYGQFVAAGEWRDYAIDSLRDVAVFSIFRRASEAPLYRIEKRPKLAKRQGAWLVQASNGANLRRGHDLAQVLRVFDKQRLKLAP